MSLIKNLEWRYATKKFNPEKKVSEDDIAIVKKAIQLSASSYGLQLYKVFVIENPNVREKLKTASWGQTQITDASHLFVFCHYNDVTPDDIDAHIQDKAQVIGADPKDMEGYGTFLKQALGAKTKEELQAWTAKQVYIALGNLLAACGELQIDACPMEGFDPAQYDEILGLKEKGLSATVVATVGYRSDEDQTQELKKFRKTTDELFETVGDKALVG